MMVMQQVVIPAKAGIQGLCNLLKRLAPGLRRGDGWDWLQDLLQLHQE